MATSLELPVGIHLLNWCKKKCCPQTTSLSMYRISVLLLTFATYTSYHAAKKPLSVVKTYFNRSCSGLVPPPDIIIDDSNRNNWCDWAPFDEPAGGALLGVLDSSFLFAYAAAMFFSGFVAERVSLRYFLAVGMISSGVSCYLFGIAHHLQIHVIYYYIFVQIFSGIVQSTGWPGVVAVMGKWFGKNKRGLIFGLWNSHTSVGNILGTLVASRCLQADWGLSFMVPGMIIAGLGVVNFFFLVESPELIDCPRNNSHIQNNQDEDSAVGTSSDDSANSDTELLTSQEVPRPYTEKQIFHSTSERNEAIGFIDALKLPDVVEFSICLFFSKCVSYTLLFWLPFYINKSTPFSAKLSADVSTICDLGGIAGGIFAGAVSDYSGMSALTCSIMLIISLPLLLLYYWFGSINFWLNCGILVLVGFFVNGPYALITTDVSAQLGTRRSLSNNNKALATVTAIIDGTGSIGAALGPLLVGLIYPYGWEKVFYMLIASNAFAFLALLRLVRKELLMRSSQMNDVIA